MNNETHDENRGDAGNGTDQAQLLAELHAGALEGQRLAANLAVNLSHGHGEIVSTAISRLTVKEARNVIISSCQLAADALVALNQLSPEAAQRVLAAYRN